MNLSSSMFVGRACIALSAVLLTAACGGGGAGGQASGSGREDVTPDVFSFATVSEANAGVRVVSEPVTVMGIGAPVPIRVVGGEYRVDDGVFTSVPGKVAVGSRVMLAVQASLDPGESSAMLVSIGGVDAVFEVTTRGTVVANKQVPSDDFPTLEALLPGLKPGDVVDVRPLASGQPYPPVKFKTAGKVDRPIILRGVRVNGRLPQIRGYSEDVGGAVKFEGSDHMVLDSFEVTNGANALSNVDPQAPSRALHCISNQAHAVTIRRTRVFDCLNHGILGNDRGSGSLTLDRVEVTTSGCDMDEKMTCESEALKHPVYVATDPEEHPGSVLRVINSYLHDNIAGETIKSRAQRAEIRGSWIESTSNGAQDRALGLYGYQEFEASIAEPIHHDVVGNVIVVDGARTSSMARFGGDGTGSTFGRTRFVNNTVLLGESYGKRDASQPVIRLDGELEAFVAHNNIVQVVGAPEQRNVVLVRENAGLQWMAGGPRMLLTHNHVPEGSVLLRTKGTGSNNTFTFGQTPPPGYELSDWVRAAAPGFLSDASLTEPNLRLAPDSPLRLAEALGTRLTNREPLAIPDALLQPTHNPVLAVPGLIQRGAARVDAAASPVLGAYD